MFSLPRIQWDLGAKRLWSDWKSLCTTKDLKADVFSGLTVACVAIPLSLAIALASGVSPAAGLISAIVGGLVCAAFGGTPLAVSGPTAAMAVLIAAAVQKHGLGGVLFIGFGCGLLQIVSGMFGFGKWARLVPTPVILGFSAGIGAVILIGQLPRALGLPPPPDGETLRVLTHLADYVHALDLKALAVSAGTIALILGLPKVWPRVPSTLVAVVVVTAVVAGFGIDTALIGAIPDSLPPPSLPEFPREALGSLLLTTLAVFAFATIETLLSSIAVDKIAVGLKHDPNQELIGQGLGNLATSLFGGIPVAGVIARSALNAQSGGRTRRAAAIHALVLLGAVFFASQVIALIPLAALAGVLLAAAGKMLNVEDFRALLKVSRTEALVYGITFVTIVAVDLLAGIQVGLLAAVLIVAIRVARTTVAIQEGEVARVRLAGPLTFLASNSLEDVRLAVGRSPRAIVDIGEVSRVDASAAEALITIVGESWEAGRQVFLQNTRPSVRDVLERADVAGVLRDRLLVSECEVQHALFDQERHGFSRLAFGVERFRADRDTRLRPMLEKLAFDQKPHTLFVTCSDSRINPHLLTGTDLGELFVVRNVGNAFPPYLEGTATSEGGALEFGLVALGIREIVICGHTGCGAMKAVSGLVDLSRTQTLARYLASSPFLGLHGAFRDPDDCARANVLSQRRNLMTYPFIRELVRAGELKIHLWLYDLARADVDAWNETTGQFDALSGARNATLDTREGGSQTFTTADSAV